MKCSSSRSRSLYLEAGRASATTSFLELSSFGLNTRFDGVVGMRIVDRGSVSEMFDGLSG